MKKGAENHLFELFCAYTPSKAFLQIAVYAKNIIK